MTTHDFYYWICGLLSYDDHLNDDDALRALIKIREALKNVQVDEE